MPIPVNFFTLTRNAIVYAFKPESISLGDDETLEVKINRDGDINVIPLVKKSVTLTLEGAVDTDLVVFEQEREQNIIDLLNGTSVGEDILIATGYTIYSTYLRKVTPSSPITVNGKQIFDSVELEFVSQVYV
jgi:hypothetical protein